jgi:hypothetical protein
LSIDHNRQRNSREGPRRRARSWKLAPPTSYVVDFAGSPSKVLTKPPPLMLYQRYASLATAPRRRPADGQLPHNDMFVFRP